MSAKVCQSEAHLVCLAKIHKCCLYYFSATINPILYSLMSAKYRDAFRDALCSFSGSRKRGSVHSPSRSPRRAGDFSFYQTEREVSFRYGDDWLKSTESNSSTFQGNKASVSRKARSVSIYRNPAHHYPKGSTYANGSSKPKSPSVERKTRDLSNESNSNGCRLTSPNAPVPFTEDKELCKTSTLIKANGESKFISENYFPNENESNFPSTNSYPIILVTSCESQDHLMFPEGQIWGSSDIITSRIPKSVSLAQMVVAKPYNFENQETCV